MIAFPLMWRGRAQYHWHVIMDISNTRDVLAMFYVPDVTYHPNPSRRILPSLIYEDCPLSAETQSTAPQRKVRHTTLYSVNLEL